MPFEMFRVEATFLHLPPQRKHLFSTRSVGQVQSRWGTLHRRIRDSTSLVSEARHETHGKRGLRAPHKSLPVTQRSPFSGLRRIVGPEWSTPAAPWRKLLFRRKLWVPSNRPVRRTEIPSKAEMGPTTRRCGSILTGLDRDEGSYRGPSPVARRHCPLSLGF